jgi:hypothetical protein
MFVNAKYCTTCGDVRPCKCDAEEVEADLAAEREEYEPQEFEE